MGTQRDEEPNPNQNPNLAGVIRSPCGKWRVEWWESSVFVDSYNSVPVAVMVIKDCITGAQVAGSGDLRDASIEPIRFLGPRRMLVYSREEKSYFDFCFPSGDLYRLSRAEDARDDYAAIVLTAAPQGRWVVVGLFGPCALFCLLAAGAMIYDRSVGAAVGALWIGVAFATLAAWLATEHHQQVFDPARGEITVNTRSWLYKSETRYGVADFAGIERRRRGGNERVVLIGRRELVLLNDTKTAAISVAINLGFSRS